MFFPFLKVGFRIMAYNITMPIIYIKHNSNIKVLMYIGKQGCMYLISTSYGVYERPSEHKYIVKALTYYKHVQ